MLHRRIATAQEQAQLATVGEQIDGSGQDWEEETLSSEEEGLVFFDGGHDLHFLLCCAVLCCAVLCCAVLCCAVLKCAALRCAALRRAVPCHAVPCRAVLCGVLLCGAVLCCAVRCCAVLCCAVRCSLSAADACLFATALSCKSHLCGNHPCYAIACCDCSWMRFKTAIGIVRLSQLYRGGLLSRTLVPDVRSCCGVLPDCSSSACGSIR